MTFRFDVHWTNIALTNPIRPRRRHHLQSQAKIPTMNHPHPMNKPEKEIEIEDPKPAPTGYGSHHLVWDENKKRWSMRVTVDIGEKLCGKRVCVRFKAQDLHVATIKRDAIIEAFRALGLKIRPRMQRGKNVQGHPCRAADGIQIDGLSASDAPSCSGLPD
jgi:hypothetical protein